MFMKLLAVIVFFTLLAAAVLGLREQRLVLRHRVARLHAAMDRSRQRTWDLQVRVARRTRAAALRRSIRRAGLVLTPRVPRLAGEGGSRGAGGEARPGRPGEPGAARPPRLPLARASPTRPVMLRFPRGAR